MNESLNMLVRVQQLIGLGGLSMLGAMSYDIYKKNKSKKKLATATLGNLEQFSDLEGTNGIKISEDLQLSEKYSNEGTMIFGSTGSGKTTKIMIPNLLSNDLKGSIIVTDPKGELYRLTSNYQNKVCKRNVLVFNPLNPSKSSHYNPLEACKNDTEVEQLASDLILNGIQALELETGKSSGGSNLEWVMMATPLLTASLLYHKNLEYPYNNIYTSVKFLIDYKDKQIEKILVSSKNESVLNQWRIYRMVAGADRTKGSIKITLATNLKLFLNENIAEITKKSDFKADNLRYKDTILYICYKENQANYLSPLLSVFYGQILNHLIDSDGNKHITLLLDECGNIGRIPRLATNVATVRSRNISTLLIFQDINQLYRLYGDCNGHTILNNLKTKILLPASSDLNTLSYFVKLCDKEEVRTSNVSNSVTGHTTISNGATTRDLFTIDELRTMEKHEYIAVIHNKKVIKSKQNFYFENKEYIDRVQINKNDICKDNTMTIKNNIKPYKYIKDEENELTDEQETQIGSLLSQIWSEDENE